MSSSQQKPNSSGTPSNDQTTSNNHSPFINISTANAGNHSQPISPPQISGPIHDNDRITSSSPLHLSPVSSISPSTVTKN